MEIHPKEAPPERPTSPTPYLPTHPPITHSSSFQPPASPLPSYLQEKAHTTTHPPTHPPPPEIMEIHHKKHHQAYITNLNIALAKLAEAEAKGDVSSIISLQPVGRWVGG